MPSPNPNTPDFPAPRNSRAERLMKSALAKEASEGEHATVARISAPVPTRNNSARKAVRARELNKRIRDALRDQTEAVYGSYSTEGPAAPAIGEGTVKASSSWEDIANEIAPVGGQGRRGLATGAARGGSLRDPNAKPSHPVWRAAPSAPLVIPCPQPSPSQGLHEALCGEERNSAHGVHYLVSHTADKYDARFSSLRERLEKVLAREAFPHLSGARVQDLLFVDIETTGLSSGAPLFLVGALSMEQDARLDLFLARDYPEECALLAAFHELAEGKTLVTFNGKSFDWPYIEGRSRAHRLSFSAPRAHFDLLHHARRVWKHSLPNCKLQTLELYLCGRTRIDDVPGSQIPRAYHEFVATHARTGAGAHLMAPILHHNALDILTTAELLCLAGEE